MILKYLMAAVRKGPSGALERVPSAGSRSKPNGAPLRAIHPNSSPVYKTQSEASLTAGLSKLSISDNKSKPVLKRNLSGNTGTNGLVKNFSDAARLLQNETVKNVVVVAGAGISTPSGIPDFRSPGTGLYDNLQQYNIPYPEAIFDIDYFFINPRPFFTLAKELYPSGKYRPNYIHYFVRLLYDKGLLLRMYTQNIDGLERLAGVPAEKLVEAHGTFATATCTTCKHKMEGYEIKEKIFSDKLPRCPTRGCVGIVKPDIVFFGEDLPRKFYSYMKDMLQADMVLVMGTSLEVQPFAGIIDTVRFNVPRVLFNREAVGPFKYSRRTQDVVIAGDLVDNMVKFATEVGWKEDMVQLITKEEGTFTIAKKTPTHPKGPLKPKQPAKLNKAPVTQTNPNKVKNYNSIVYRGRATFDLYDTDSSVESTESESDVTSSESDSSEEDRKSKFRGLNRGKVNNSLKNGNGKTANVRCKSAKISDTPKREIHTQRLEKYGKYSPAGNMSGRSVQSESAINTNLSKRRRENVTKITPKEETNDKKASITPSKNEVSPANTDRPKATQADRENVLKKYGLSTQPIVNNLMKTTNDVNKPVQEVHNGKVSAESKKPEPTNEFAVSLVQRRANNFKTSEKNMLSNPVENSQSSEQIHYTPQVSADRKLSVENVQVSADRKLSVENTKESADKKLTVNSQKVSTDRKLSVENVQVSADRKLSVENTKESTDRKLSVDNLQVSSDKKLSVEQVLIASDVQTVKETASKPPIPRRPSSNRVLETSDEMHKSENQNCSQNSANDLEQLALTSNELLFNTDKAIRTALVQNSAPNNYIERSVPRFHWKRNETIKYSENETTGSQGMMGNTSALRRRAVTPSERKEKTVGTVKSETAVASGYFVDDLITPVMGSVDESITRTVKKKIPKTDIYSISINSLLTGTHIENVENCYEGPENGEGAEFLEQTEEDIKTPGMIEHVFWKQESTSRDKFLQMLDRGKIPEETASLGSIASSRNENHSQKKAKKLSEKTARSFKKYANLASHHKKGSGKKHRKKKRRTGHKDRPSPGSKSSSSKDLNTVNSRPYGFAHKQTQQVKGVGPFNRTSFRTLNQAINSNNNTQYEVNFRSSSADLPKISYRHKLQMTPTFDPQFYGEPEPSVSPHGGLESPVYS